MSRNYQSDNCPLEIKTNIFALEASLPGQIYLPGKLTIVQLVLSTCGAQILELYLG